MLCLNASAAKPTPHSCERMPKGRAPHHHSSGVTGQYRTAGIQVLEVQVRGLARAQYTTRRVRVIARRSGRATVRGNAA